MRAAHVAVVLTILGSPAWGANGLPWEPLSNPGEELARISEILRRVGPTRERLKDLAQIADSASDPLARGIAEFAAATFLTKEGNAEEGAAHFLSPWVSKTALRAYALDSAARASQVRNPALALRAWKEALEGYPDYVHRDSVQLRLSRLLVKSGQRDEALPLLKTVSETESSALRDEALFEMAGTLLSLGRTAEALTALENLYYQRPTSRFSGESGRKLAALAPKRTPQQAYELALLRAERLFEEGRYREALAGYTAILPKHRALADVTRVTLRQGICQYQIRQSALAEKTLARLGQNPEALYTRALVARRQGKRDSYRAFLSQLLRVAPLGEWAEEALVSLARHHLLEDEMATAHSYYERLDKEFPQGRYADEAHWNLLWSFYRRGRTEEAAAGFEKAARENPASPEHARFLFWAARAQEKSGRTREAEALYRQVLLGYKNSYYGRQAQTHLVQVAPGAGAAALSEGRDGIDLSGAIRVVRQERLARIGQLLVLGLGDEAEREAETGVAGHEDDAAFQAVFAWLQFQRGRYGLAITAMRRAFPFHVAATGDLLPEDVWRILYPLKYRDYVERYSQQRGLDPYLVAAVIRQESTFLAGVRSRAGADGLMQIMPYTGRVLARSQGKAFRRSSLYDPETNIRYGTIYLKQMIDRFGGRVDYALASYNAGPNRVVKWTGMDLTLDSEVFIEEIPFTETRDYVRAVLRNETLYRRLYGSAAPAAP